MTYSPSDSLFGSDGDIESVIFKADPVPDIYGYGHYTLTANMIRH